MLSAADIPPVVSVLFHGAATAAIVNERVAIVLGVSTLAFGLATVTSCRVVPRLTGRALDPVKRAGYRRFVRFHGYYWWVFVAIVAAHFAVAYWHAGIWPG